MNFEVLILFLFDLRDMFEPPIDGPYRCEVE